MNVLPLLATLDQLAHPSGQLTGAAWHTDTKLPSLRIVPEAESGTAPSVSPATLIGVGTAVRFLEATLPAAGAAGLFRRQYAQLRAACVRAFRQ